MRTTKTGRKTEVFFMQRWMSRGLLGPGAELGSPKEKKNKRWLSPQCIPTLLTKTYTAFLQKYGIVEEGSEAFGCNRTGAIKDHIMDRNAVVDSPVQRVLHQVLLEKYGGPAWTYEALLDIVKQWLIEADLIKDSILAFAIEQNASIAKVINSEMGRIGRRSAGSLKREMTIQNALAGGLFTVRGSWEGGWTTPKITFLNVGITIKAQLVTDGLVKVDDQVNVDFPIFEFRNVGCYAQDALTTDPGHRLGIRLHGVDNAGNGWSQHLRAGGEKAAKRANTMYDWLTNTGMAQADHKIARRYYREAIEDGRWMVEYT